MADPIRMDHNISYAQLKHHGWDDRHVVFGKVIDGFDVLKNMEQMGRQSGKPSKRIIIEDCDQCGISIFF